MSDSIKQADKKRGIRKSKKKKKKERLPVVPAESGGPGAAQTSGLLRATKKHEGQEGAGGLGFRCLGFVFGGGGWIQLDLDTGIFWVNDTTVLFTTFPFRFTAIAHLRAHL